MEEYFHRLHHHVEAHPAPFDLYMLSCSLVRRC